MLACALAFGVLALVLRRAGPARGERDFLTGGGEFPPWAVALAFAASEASAMTVLGVPAAAYREDWRYLQFFAGSAAARVFLALWLLPSMRVEGAVT
ncbi:MAG: Sodium iodide symporter, partial [Elusimicrobia bacterium]